jgi:hypothetical protein
MDPREADRMDELAPKLARYLLDRGFKFMAHNSDEFDYAMILGWIEDDIILFGGGAGVARKEESKAAQEFLSYYARARSYIGNRIHGGIVARSFGANVLCIGYDTRLRAVEDVGGVICTPKTFRPQLFRNWLADKPLFPPMAQWFRDQQAIFKKVMAEA